MFQLLQASSSGSMIDTFQHRGSKNELPFVKFRLACIVYCVMLQKVHSCYVYIYNIQLYINLVVTTLFSKISYNNNILKTFENFPRTGVMIVLSPN